LIEDTKVEDTYCDRPDVRMITDYEGKTFERKPILMHSQGKTKNKSQNTADVYHETPE
jgi:hypothetical protein